MPEPKKLDFQLEANCKHVDPRVFEDAQLVFNDPRSTTLEKLLARCVFDLAMSHNQLVDALELGQVTMTVYEKDIRREQAR
jgi:hypothetical protein